MELPQENNFNIPQPVKTGWENTPKIVKRLLYVGAIIIGFLLFLLLKFNWGNKNQADYFFDKWNHKNDSNLKVINNKLGQLSYISEVTKLNKDQMEKYVENDAKLKELTKKYSDLMAVVTKKMGVYVDTIQTTFHDTLPCDDFEKVDSLKNRYYSFKYMITKSGFMINNLEFPDTSHTIIGEKKSGFLNLKRTYVVEETHSNKYMKVKQMEPILNLPKNNNLKWFGGGAAAVIATRIAIKAIFGK